MSRKIASMFFLALVSLLSLAFFHDNGTCDVREWRWRAEKIDTYGLKEGYARQLAEWRDYPPLTNVVFLGINWTAKATGTSWFFAFKGALLLFLWLTTAVFFLWKRNLFLAALLQLVLLLNSMALGYLDILLAPAFLGMLWALEKKRLAWFWCFFTLACLIKWIPLILLPLVLLHLWRDGAEPEATVPRRLARLLLPGWTAVVVAGLCIAYFGLHSIYGAFDQALKNPFLSGTTLNAYWILTHILERILPGTFPPPTPMDSAAAYQYASPIVNPPRLLLTFLKVPFFLVYLSLGYRYLKHKNSFENLLLFAIAVYLAYFTFNTGVHENHLYPLCLIAPVLYLEDRRHRELAAILIFFANLNLFIFYGIQGIGWPFQPFAYIDILFSVVGVALFFALLAGIWSPPRAEAPAQAGESGLAAS